MACFGWRMPLALLLAASLALAFGLPLDISNSGGHSLNPRIYVDSNGVVHAVWQECALPEPSPGESPTPTPEPSPTASPSPTPTPTPTPTPAPTPPFGECPIGCECVTGPPMPETCTMHGMLLCHAMPITCNTITGPGMCCQFPDGEARGVSSRCSLYAPAPGGVGGEPEAPVAECPEGRNWEIFYANNFGGSWHAPVDVSNTAADSVQPRIAVDSQGEVFVAWREWAPMQASYGPWYANSLDRGRNWQPSAQLFGGGISSQYYEMAVDRNDTVGMVFIDGNGMASYISYRAGVFGRVASLDNANGGNHPRLAPGRSGGFHIVWDRGMEIWYVRSSGGALVSVSRTVGGSQKPDVAADSLDVAHVVWREANDTSGSLPAQWEIWYAGVNGNAVQNEQDISNTPNQDSNWPRIDADAMDRLHVVWMDNAPGNYDILYVKSEDGGVSFSNWTDIANTTGFSFLPAVRADGNGYPNVLWGDDTPGNNEIYWNGWNSSWRGARDVSSTNSNSYSHDFALDGRNKVHAVFEDNFPGNFDIYYLQDNGFGPNSTRALKISVAGNCTYEEINLTVKDQSDNPISGAAVGVFVYNTSLNWDSVANLTSGADGDAGFTPSRAGSYKAVADKTGYPQQVKFFSIGACAQPSPTPAASPSPGASPSQGISPTPNATATPVPTLTPTPGPTSTSTAAPEPTGTPGAGGGCCAGFLLLLTGIGAVWVAKKQSA